MRYSKGDVGAIAVGVVLLLIAVYAAGGLIIFWIWNALANWFGFKTINWLIGSVLFIVLHIIGNTFRRTTSGS